MSLLKQIVQGHVNEFLSNVGIKQSEKKEKIFKSRAKICINCPLKSGNTCNRSKYINPETLEVSITRKAGFVQGCGCRLSAKQRSEGANCPAGFWGGEFN